MLSVTVDRPDGLSNEEWADLCETLGVYAREVTPVRTGELRDGWETKITRNEVTIKNSVDYAGYVDQGTKYMAPRDMTGQIESHAQDILSEFLGS